MQNTTIEWATHSFNPWLGCDKISPACLNCYAEAIAERFKHAEWGRLAQRRFFSDDHWHKPVVWNTKAAMQGARLRVFAGSMCDVFENRRDLDAHRARLWSLIEATPNLDWLLLTKRPHLVGQLVPWITIWPQNVWLGCTVEDQTRAEERLPHLLSHPAAVRFISAEPLLGPLDLSRWFQAGDAHPLNWVIAGGESGPHARPTHPAWFTGLRDQCVNANVAYLFKQWGNYLPERLATPDLRPSRSKILFFKRHNDIPAARMVWVPQKGYRFLDGRVWDQFPAGGMKP